MCINQQRCAVIIAARNIQPVNLPRAVIMINIERGTILRALFSCVALQTWFAGMYESRSLHFLVTRSSGDFGYWVLMLLAVLGVVLLMDTVVNDMMHRRYRLEWALEMRPTILMTMAILQAGEVFVATHVVESVALSLHGLIMSVFMAVSAFRDVQHRYKGNNKCVT